MTYDEVCDLLAIAAAYDRRTLGDADGDAWEAAVGDLPFADARLAVVAHYRETRDWIMPADVRQRVRSIRDERSRFIAPPAPPAELVNDEQAYRAYLRASEQRAAGTPAPQSAIGGAE
jgi:hypothetical protein